MKVKVAKWGNSIGVRLPKAAAEAAGIDAGSELDLVVEGRELRLKRSAKIPYYRLEDLLAEMDRLGPKNRPEFVDWGPDVGAEIIDDDYSRGGFVPPGGRSGVGRSAADARTRAKRRPARRRAHRP
jgi:antitoxin MazE